ncbi:hypothetical protein ACUW92_002399 [Staphylococcus epidermidis]|nr:hypothetical protein [Staphylococcus epidermidis]MDS3941001.1 hypothetical protein [Staphylococcus epidermidis]
MLKFEEVKTDSLNGWGAALAGVAAGAGGAAAIGGGILVLT